MSVGVRELTVLGEFKPFGLVAEALEGKPIDNVLDKYDYFLFDPEGVKQKDEFGGMEHPASSFPSDGLENELFIRGNKIIWTTGSSVYKRFTLNSTVLMVCWCRLGNKSEALLCVLQVDTLTIFNTSGELTSIPLPGMISSIWPLPFGLLLQQAAEANYPTSVPFSSSSPGIGRRDMPRPRRDLRQSPLQNFGVGNFDHIMKASFASISSHLILSDALEEPQPSFIDGREKLKIMRDFDERTIWTSVHVPLMASYSREKMQHSLWVVEKLGSMLHEVADSNSVDVVPAKVLPRQYSFRRIWQAKGSLTASAKVFLATDDDSAPIVCFLLQELKTLQSVKLQIDEINSEILINVKPDMTWRIPAIAAEPVAVTRRRFGVGQLPFADIIVLSPDSTLFLYSGNQCLCRYMLTSSMRKGQVAQNIAPLESMPAHNLKIVGLADAVGFRVSVILNNGQMLRCMLRKSPSCSLVDDCITAMAEGLSSGFYSHFLRLLWSDGDPAFLSTTCSEWESFSSIILQMCGMPESCSQQGSRSVAGSSWGFLIASEYHRKYHDHNLIDFSSEGSVNRLDSISNSAIKKDALSPGKTFYKQFLIECLDVLHAVYENLKLINLRKKDLEFLVVILCKVANYLEEECYVEHYFCDFPFLCERIRRHQTSSPRSAPSLYRWFESCLLRGFTSANPDDIPSLLRKDGSSAVNCARMVVAFYSLLSGARWKERKLSSGVYCSIASGSSSTPEEQVVLAMVAEGFGLQQLDLLPVGVSLPLRHTLDKCRESPPTDWPAAAYALLGRQDLALSCSGILNKSEGLETQTNVHLIALSTPYMLNLRPVTVPSTMSELTGNENLKYEDTDPADGSMLDGMEHILNSSTHLRYGRDLRLNEVRRLLCSSQPVAVQTSVNASASDQDFQQARLWQLAQRTTALPFGRGPFTLSTACTLLTEALTVPQLVLAGRLPAQQNATVNLDPNVRNVEELRAWPEFHNAVAAGLRLAPLQGKIPRPWIMYNKPAEPNSVHAGLLLALGLHGHLTVLTVADIFQYYQQEHESTTVGLMLGLAVSYRGTMEPTMSKTFYVHLPGRLPSTFPELEVPTVLQSAALMSIGLIFEGSAHLQTMQFLLGEIGRRSGGDNVLEREGYAVSAGFSLGLVALGQGDDTLACIDMLIDRLFHYAGGKEFRNDKFPVMSSTDEQNRGAGQVLDGVSVNVDVTAPGAIIALALMFLKTESEVVVSRLAIPCTHFELQYVRPDFIMLRVIAQNLIMWSRIYPSTDWIESQIPDVVRTGVQCLKGDHIVVGEVDQEALVQAYVNIVTGACISLGLKYAGSRNENVQEVLNGYAVYFLNEIKPVLGPTTNTFPKGLSRFVDRGTLEICLHIVSLCLSVVMAGSGNLKTFRLLRFLRNRNPADGQANYGFHMAVSMAIGFLFLGSGMRTFSTSKSAIASLLVTLYPRFPTGPNDNRCHLQAYRHFYVLATEARWLRTVDVDTGLPVYAPLEVTLKETEHHAETSFCEVTPCILPERSILRTVRVCGPRYWPQVIDLVPDDKPWWSSADRNHPFTSGILYIKRKVGACSYVDDPVGCQSLLSRVTHKAFSLTSMKSHAAAPNGCNESGLARVDQLISTFSSDPSIIAFAQLCRDPSWIHRSDIEFQEFCLQVLFECVGKDRPTLLQIYLSLYTIIRSMAEQFKSQSVIFSDTLCISSLKLALTYNEALLRGRLSSARGSIVQSIFLGSLGKRADELFSSSQELKKNFYNYLNSGTWPIDKFVGKKDSILLSWYLVWFGVPAPSVIRTVVEKIDPKHGTSSYVPLLHLLLPRTRLKAIAVIDNFFFSPQCNG